MSVLGICGSPHPDGNTAYSLRRALDLIRGLGIATEYVSLANRDITPCDGCFACRRGACVHDDGMASIYEALRRCDGLILASPVYMGLVTGQMKVFMDRTVVFRTVAEYDAYLARRGMPWRPKKH